MENSLEYGTYPGIPNLAIHLLSANFYGIIGKASTPPHTADEPCGCHHGATLLNFYYVHLFIFKALHLKRYLLK